MNQLPGDELVALSADLQRSLQNNFTVFGEHAFRKHRPGQDRRGVLNASLWDVMSTGLSKIPEDTVLTRKDALLSRFYELMVDDPVLIRLSHPPHYP